ncbi:MAG: hypothetical protein PHY92_03155 [Alphaproteobacteria bacterium]|nr:hypothetical protein [Alphaproteobacteria bacterium]
MGARFIFVLLALFSVSFLAPESFAAPGVALNAPCSVLGETTMAEDHTAILLCAFPDPSAATVCDSTCKWKPMSPSAASAGGSDCPMQNLVSLGYWASVGASSHGRVVVVSFSAAHGTLVNTYQCWDGVYFPFHYDSVLD